ncbi:DNA translocase FtsK [Consotaella salsifontis]|uniref:DNA translocase FtsK n=1 Tax=Consotaella salsifontis TaxID=1365950 RepID=A0A1T4SDY3_9HYPH|nr:DNA translocase FtsK [Consotaella salsifontis]SKA26071.1 DNA translocase FtsK [Consotaella salsifontis]
MASTTIETRHGLSALMRRQVQTVVGLGLLGVAVFLGVSLASWDVADPSLSLSNHNAVANLAGSAGAVASDLFMQVFGLASVLGVALLAIWGLLLSFGWPIDRVGRRAWFGLAGISLGAAAIGCLPAPEGWPLPIGLGGIVGDLVLKFPALATGSYPSGGLAIALAIMIAAPAGWLFLSGAALIDRHPSKTAALPVRRHEEEEDDEDEGEGRFALLMGAVAHVVYSAKAFWHRHFARSRANTLEEAVWGAGTPDVAQRRTPAVVMRGDHTMQRAAPAPIFDDEDEEDEDDGAFIQPTQAAPSAAAPAPHDDFDYDEEDFDDEADSAPWTTGEDPSEDGVSLTPDDRISPHAPPPAEDGNGWRSLLSGNIIAFPGRKSAKASEPAARPAAPAARPASASQGEKAVRVVPEAGPRPAARQSRTGSGKAVPAPRAFVPGPFEMPALDFLSEPKSRGRDATLSLEALQENARLLEGVLEDFGVKGEIIEVRPGPVVTLYELEPAPGIKSSRVIGLADDIARSMSAVAARVAVVPGKNAIGIELPNQRRETVYLREMIASEAYAHNKGKLPITLGKTIGGEPVIADLAKMPHLLVAGTTGSGKSVAINTMILSLLYRMTPDECRLIMIDPKMLELSVYDGIPHLLSPVVTDPKKAVVALKWTVREMEDRYRKMSKVGVRNIDGFNTRVRQAIEKGETISRTVQTGFDRETGEPIFESEEFDLEPLPYIVVIIDEMADLMMVAGKDIEGAVQRLAQMARAAGIHVIMATQRPSVDVITGTIKANFPTRISFQVTSKIDSRTILGEQGAEQLLGMGDMLFMAGGGRIQRVHGPFVDDSEVEKIVAHLKNQGVPDYLDAILEDEDEDGASGSGGGSGGGGSGGDDSADLYDQAVAIVLRDGKASTSYVQRRLGIGYNRAASIIERMEQEGVVGPANHAGKREILVPTEQDRM